MSPSNGVAAGSPSTPRASLSLSPARASWAHAIRTICSPTAATASAKKAKSRALRPRHAPTHGNIRHGFVYERAPHITLKSIANNAEIDVIWDKWQETLTLARKALNAALGKAWETWEIPRVADAKWATAAKDAHAKWWEARIALKKEIDASIAAKAEIRVSL